MSNKQTVREALEDVTGRCVVNISTYPLEVLTSANKALTALDDLMSRSKFIEVLEDLECLDHGCSTDGEVAGFGKAIDAAIKAVKGEM